MKQFKIWPKFLKKFQNGYPLVFKEAIAGNPKRMDEGDIFHLVDEEFNYVATAYYGVQNKGIGWVLTQNDNDKINSDFFSKRVAKALNLRKSFFNSKDTNAFRIINGEGDDLPGMTVDYYAGYFLITWYNRGIYNFSEEIIEALKLNNPIGVYQKKRFGQGGSYINEEEHIFGDEADLPLIIQENGINYATYFNDGPMTGIFLDQKEIRNLVKEKYAKDKSVLNTFSYTGAFSVAAAIGGAKETTSIDLAKRSIPKTKEMFEINGIDLDNHRIIAEDIFNHFAFAKRRGFKYDLIILDPPSFAQSKKHKFSTAKDYPKLISQSIDILNPGGIILASTNNSTFDMNRFLEFIDEAAINSAKAYKILEQHTLPFGFNTDPNFPEGDYLKVAFVQIF